MDPGALVVPLKLHLDELRAADRCLADERQRFAAELAAERRRIDDMRHEALIAQLATVVKQHELVQERWGRRFEEEARESKERLQALAHRDELQERRIETVSRLLYVGVGLALAIEIALQLLKH